MYSPSVQRLRYLSLRVRTYLRFPLISSLEGEKRRKLVNLMMQRSMTGIEKITTYNEKV